MALTMMFHMFLSLKPTGNTFVVVVVVAVAVVVDDVDVDC